MQEYRFWKVFTNRGKIRVRAKAERYEHRHRWKKSCNAKRNEKKSMRKSKNTWKSKSCEFMQEYRFWKVFTDRGKIRVRAKAHRYKHQYEHKKKSNAKRNEKNTMRGKHYYRSHKQPVENTIITLTKRKTVQMQPQPTHTTHHTEPETTISHHTHSPFTYVLERTCRLLAENNIITLGGNKRK